LATKVNPDSCFRPGVGSYASTSPALLFDLCLGVPHEVAEAVIEPCTDVIGISANEVEAHWVVVEWHPDLTWVVMEIVEDGN